MSTVSADREQGEALHVLIIDDEETFGQSLAVLLERRAATVTVATDGASGLRALQARPFDMVLLDHVLPDCRGLDLIPSVLAVRPEPLVLMMTAYGTVDDAVEAMRRGAHDYITKSADVRRIVERVQQTRALVEARRRAATALGALPPLLGTSEAMDEVRHRLGRVARSPTTPVLLTGESGTGKELAARTLHALGAEPEEPFVAVDCVSLPATLASSELFAPSADPSQPSDVGAGTMFLDEIGDMDLGLQAKLLRVLESRSGSRRGLLDGAAAPSAPSEMRVVAATHADLAQRVASGQFRLDLYHRLSVFRIQLPPLRERREDIPLLIRHFVDELALRLGVAPRPLDAEARDLLLSYDYPGNVRELRNILEQALIMCDSDRLEASHLPERLRELRGYLPVPSRSGLPGAILLEFVPDRDTLEELEQRLIAEVLERADGHITKAAGMLGISRFALSRRLDKHAKGASGRQPGKPRGRRR